MQLVPRHCAIDMHAWAGVCKLEDRDGEWYECYWLKLPSYGWHYDLRYDEDRWSQLVWFWHGKHGFHAFWDALPEPQGDKPHD